MKPENVLDVLKPQASHTQGEVYAGLTNICVTTGTTAVSFGVAGKEMGCMNMEHSTAEADAKRLAHCWNCHDQLVEALRHLLAYAKAISEPGWNVEKRMAAQALDAVAKSEGNL